MAFRKEGHTWSSIVDDRNSCPCITGTPQPDTDPCWSPSSPQAVLRGVLRHVMRESAAKCQVASAVSDPTNCDLTNTPGLVLSGKACPPPLAPSVPVGPPHAESSPSPTHSPAPWLTPTSAVWRGPPTTAAAPPAPQRTDPGALDSVLRSYAGPPGEAGEAGGPAAAAEPLKELFQQTALRFGREQVIRPGFSRPLRGGGALACVGNC